MTISGGAISDGAISGDSAGTPPSDDFTGNLVQTLSLVETMEGIRTVFATLSQTIVFTESMTARAVCVVSHSMAFTDEMRVVILGELQQALALADTMDAVSQTPSDDVLELEESFSAAGSTYNVDVEDDLELEEAFVGWVNRTTSCVEYDAGLGSRSGVRLTWPYASPSLTIDLRSPKFGNLARLDTSVASIRTRDGKLKQVDDFPKIETLVMSFDAMSQELADDLKGFLEASAADEIGLLDHEDRQWRGVIITPAASIIQAGRGCRFEASFEFRGALVP